MDALKWQLVEVPSMGPMYRAVVNEEGYTVCPPIMRSTAEQIIAEHNAHAGLAQALLEARTYIDQYGSYGQLEYGRAKTKPAIEAIAKIDAALTVAGVQHQAGEVQP